MAGTAPLVSRFDYHVRADGRRDGLTEAIAHPDGSSVTRTVNYGFDLANRLTDESGSNGEGKSYSKSYELDAAGNRKSLTEMREGQLYAQTSYGYNSLDWLTGTTTQTKDATSNVAYDYDANGAQISQTTGAGAQSQTTGQKWDFEGHLLASGAVNAQGQWSGAKTSYTYDASGMRLTQASWNAAGAVTDGTSYVWDVDRVAEERDEQGVLQAVYEHGQELGPLRLVRRAGTVAAPVEQERYFIGDGQDSTRQLLDENGVVKDSYFYDAFGVGLPGGQGATENSFKYTGQQQDANGLYYLRARFYNAGTGRFLSHDPLMGSAEDPDSMHRYLYASVDPVNNVDPSGRMDFSLTGMMTALNYTMKVYDGVSAITNTAGAAMEFGRAWSSASSGDISGAGMHVALAALYGANAALNYASFASPVPTFGGGPGNFGGPDAVRALANISLKEASAVAMVSGARVISLGINGIMARNLQENMLLMAKAESAYGGSPSDMSPSDIEAGIAAKKASSSPEDQLEGEVGQYVKDQGLISSFNWKNGPNGENGQTDLETPDAIIEVTVSPNGKGPQLRNYHNNKDGRNSMWKQVILYAPNYEDAATKYAESINVWVVRNKQDLIYLLEEMRKSR